MEKEVMKVNFNQKQIKNLVKKIHLILKDIKEIQNIKLKRPLTPLEKSFLHSLGESKKDALKELKEKIKLSRRTDILTKNN